MIYLYVIFCFLILRFTVTLFNFISNPKLTHSGKHYNDLVSILIPVRDEEDDILNLLESIQKQDYKSFEVIILDDSSKDRTVEICEDFTLKDSRFILFKGNILPKGWLGKNFACDQLGKLANGKYLIFLDADEIIKTGLIHNAIHRMKMNQLSLLSLFTNQIMDSLGERIVVPLMHFLLLNLLPLRLIRLSNNPAFSAASGQFMMFNAQNYHENKWHQQVQNKVVEDVEIMKLIKKRGYKGESLLGNGFIFCRMYKSLNEAVHGFSKNLLAGFNYNVFGLLLYLILVMSGPFAIAYLIGSALLPIALSLIILSRVMISLSSGQNAFWNLLLHPVQMLVLVYISAISIQKHFTRRISWKGRIINP